MPSQDNPKTETLCQCNMAEYYTRIRESHDRIQHILRNNSIANLAVLVLQELVYIFCDCDCMVAGIVQNEQNTSTGIDGIFPQPLNTLHIGSRYIKEDHFQKLVHECSAFKIANPHRGKGRAPELFINGKSLKLMEIKETAAYRLKNEKNDIIKECGFSLDQEIVLFVLTINSETRLFILWQKADPCLHTCSGVKFGAVCCEKAGVVYPTCLESIFQQHEKRLLESMQERHQVILGTEPEMDVSTCNEQFHENRDEALEHFQTHLLREVKCSENGELYFFRTVSPMSNQLIFTINPAVRERFKDNLIDRQLISKGILFEAGRKGVVQAISLQDLYHLIDKDDFFHKICMLENSKSDYVIFFPILFNNYLFGLTVLFPGSNRPPLSSIMSTLIEFHQANVQYIVEAIFQDVLNYIRELISMGTGEKKDIESCLVNNHAIPPIRILEVKTSTINNDSNPFSRLLKDECKEDALFNAIQQHAQTPKSKGFQPVLPDLHGRLELKQDQQKKLGFRQIYPYCRIVSVENRCFIILLLAEYPLDRMTLQLKGILTDFTTAFESALQIQRAHKAMLRRGTRAAVAAVMGRNMSHNIGSHVLSYWTKRMQHDEENRRLLGYLRARMDFIAEIATTDQPAWSTSMLLCRDILTPFFRQTALLDYLGRSENVHFTPCTTLGCGTGEQHVLLSFVVERFQEQKESKQIFGWRGWHEEVNQWTGKTITPGQFCFDANRQKYTRFDERLFPLPAGKDVPVAIPHGLTGLHAFYCILENFIRNCVKHGGRRKQFEVRIVVDDNDPDMIQLALVDPEQEWCGTTYDDMVGKFAEPLVDDRGELARSSWGLKEMKIAACYLRQGRSDLVDEQGSYQPVWLEAAKGRPYVQPRYKGCKQQDSTCHFGYTLYLLKPKEAVWLVEKKQNQQDLGVEQVTVQEISHRFMHSSLPHRLLFYDGCNQVLKNVVDTHALLLPTRCVPHAPPSDQPLFAAWIDHLFVRWKEKEKRSTGGIRIVFRHNDKRDIVWKKCIDGSAVTYHEATKVTPLPADREQWVFFDEHKACRKDDTLCSLHYQEISGNRPSTKQLLLELETMDTAGRELRFHELLESVLTRIVVADERIWEGFRDRKEVFLDMGIILTPVENKGLDPKELDKIVCAQLPDFVVVHQGLLDKLEDNQRNLVHSLVKEHKTILIVTSGRGIPHALIEDARFLEISTLEAVLAEEDKFALTQILYSLRRSDRV